MKKFILLILLMMTACSLPVRRTYISYDKIATTNAIKQKKIKRPSVPTFCSDSLTAVISKDDPIKKIKNPSPKTFETFLMRKNSLLFVNLKRGHKSLGNNIMELVLNSGDSIYLREMDCHGKDKKMVLDEVATR
jgi:hypothetical protein